MTNPYKGKVKGERDDKVKQQAKNILLEKSMVAAVEYYKKETKCNTAEAINAVKKIERDHFSTTRCPQYPIW